jgi:hypothetical protein
MAGTKASGRPGGNPDLKKHAFTTDRQEPCTAYLGLRLPPSNLEALKKIPHYHEKVREAIAKLIELEQTQLDGPGNEPKPATTEGSKAPTNRAGNTRG